MSNQQVATPKANGAAVGQPAQPSYAELLARLQELEAAAAAKSNGTLTIRINEKNADGSASKGTVNVYGLGRNPVCLYAEQWERLLSQEHIKAILEMCKSPKAVRKVR